MQAGDGLGIHTPRDKFESRLTGRALKIRLNRSRSLGIVRKVTMRERLIRVRSESSFEHGHARLMRKSVGCLSRYIFACSAGSFV